MPISAVDVIPPAFERMVRHLFKPFRIGQWVRLAVVGFFAGEMGFNGGCNARSPGDFTSQQGAGFPAMGLPGGAGLLFIVAVCLAVLLALVLGIALLYVNSRMRFVLFDSVLEGECRIRDFWRRRGDVAIRYFVWQLLFMICCVIALAILLVIPVVFAYGMGWLTSPSGHVLPLVLGGILLGLVFIAAIVVIGVVQVLIKDFVVPQMVFDNVSVAEGCRRLWAMMKEEKGGYAGYIGMKIVLALAAVVGLGIITVIVALVLVIPLGGIGAVAILAGRAAGLTWNPVAIAIAIVAGGLALLVLVFIAALISVPAIVFFPAYSIHFFADRYPALHAALNPPPL